MNKGQRKQEDKEARRLFGENLSLLLAYKCKGMSEVARAKHVRIGIRSLRRILKGEQGISLDNMFKVARRLDTPAWCLLLPQFDPANPPSLLKEKDRDKLKRVAQSIRELDMETAH